MLDGKKPVFVDHSGSVFVFPYQTIRFLELMAGSVDGLEAGGDALVSLAANGNGTSGPSPDAAEAEEELELDEDFLRKIREV
jgi:hypothetical protein